MQGIFANSGRARWLPSYTLIATLALLSASYFVFPSLYFHILNATIKWPQPYPFEDWSSNSPWISCHKAGVFVYVKNPCSIPFNYGPPILLLPEIPGGHKWDAVFGLCLAVMFALSLAVLPAVTTTEELLIRIGMSLSSSVLLALERGNMDVAVFILVIGSVVLASRRATTRFVGYGGFLLAAAIKFYPLAALSLIIRERVRNLVITFALVITSVIAYYLLYRNELAYVFTHLPVGIDYTMQFSGNDLPLALLGQDAGHGGYDGSLLDPGQSGAGVAKALLILRAAIFIVSAVFAICIAIYYKLLFRTLYEDRMALTTLVVFSSISLFCFLSAQNFIYRGIFLIPVVAEAYRLIRNATNSRRKMAIRIFCVLIVIVSSMPLISSTIDFVHLGRNHTIRTAVWWLYQVSWWVIATGLLSVILGAVAESPILKTFARNQPARA